MAGLDSGYGHDKSKAILPYRDLAHKPTLFFCGDGVSGEFQTYPIPFSSSFSLGSRLADRSLRMTVDMSAAAHADLLFVKEMANGDSDLATYCELSRRLWSVGNAKRADSLSITCLLPIPLPFALDLYSRLIAAGLNWTGLDWTGTLPLSCFVGENRQGEGYPARFFPGFVSPS